MICRCSKLWVFWEKRCYFSKKHLKSFQKHLARILFSRRPFKSYFCSCNLQMFKIWCFGKQMTFFTKKISKDFRSTLRIFYRECVSHFHTASEFSIQANLWVFRRSICCFWKDLFLYKIGKRGILLLLCVSKTQLLKKSETFNSLRFPGK